MVKNSFSFILTLLIFTAVLSGIHYFLIYRLEIKGLYIPIWTIYLFNAVLVMIVYSILSFKSRQGSKKILQIFMGLSFLKMVLAIIFLIPLFQGKSNHLQTEVFNFFIPYFLLLAFEVYSVNKFLQKT